MPKKKERSIIRRIMRWVWTLFLCLVVLSVLQVLSLRYIDPPFTTMMLVNRLFDRNETPHNWPLNTWRPLNEISPHLRRAVLAGEDQRFTSHRGFDFTEINRAMRDMVMNGNVRGASTITMQAARTLFLWPERSLLRKIVEAYYSLLMELLWSKERILEVYLNTVDWGNGIFGVEAASRAYYHASCSRISAFQAASLTAILPNPHRWSPTRPTPFIVKRRRQILRDMRRMPLLR